MLFEELCDTTKPKQYVYLAVPFNLTTLGSEEPVRFKVGQCVWTKTEDRNNQLRFCGMAMMWALEVIDGPLVEKNALIFLKSQFKRLSQQGRPIGGAGSIKGTTIVQYGQAVNCDCGKAHNEMFSVIGHVGSVLQFVCDTLKSLSDQEIVKQKKSMPEFLPKAPEVFNPQTPTVYFDVPTPATSCRYGTR